VYLWSACHVLLLRLACSQPPICAFTVQLISLHLFPTSTLQTSHPLAHLLPLHNLCFTAIYIYRYCCTDARSSILIPNRGGCCHKVWNIGCDC
jgi:hypothetical protein